jgi:thiamine biosynthesis protein ThiI
LRVLVLLSGGIDSPVAAYMMAEVGAEVHFIHMDNVPICDANKPVEKIVERLRKLTSQEMPLWVAPHGRVNLSQIGQTKNPHIRCVLCKRFMQRVGEALARRENCEALAMGDSLGQVASQTLRNIMVEQESVTIPILRPLIGLDKEEIIKIAKDIETFELSIENIGECGILPTKPSTHAHSGNIREAEAEMDISAMVSECLDAVKRI